MIALILAAGYGTRLYPLTENTPKALLDVKGQPILRHLIQKLLAKELRTERIVLASNHKYAKHFERWFASSKFSIPWTVLDDGSTSDQNRLGSVGDLAFCIRQCQLQDNVMVLGSDNLFRDELTGFVKLAREKKAITLGAYQLPDRALASQYGVLSVADDGRVIAFTEKPKEPPSALVSTAVYFFPAASLKKVLEYVSSQQSADTLGSFIAWLISRQSVYAYRFHGPWFDIGDMASYTQAQEFFK